MNAQDTPQPTIEERLHDLLFRLRGLDNPDTDCTAANTVAFYTVATLPDAVRMKLAATLEPIVDLYRDPDYVQRNMMEVDAVVEIQKWFAIENAVHQVE